MLWLNQHKGIKFTTYYVIEVVDCPFVITYAQIKSNYICLCGLMSSKYAPGPTYGTVSSLITFIFGQLYIELRKKLLENTVFTLTVYTKIVELKVESTIVYRIV